MEYSIQQLSRLAGVSTRTLRWYHQIGLLTPCRVADSGYRYYGAAEVDRLQDILFYRALGVELAKIKESLNAPSYDRLTVLSCHLTTLEQERSRIQTLIDCVKQTISAQERNEFMSDEAKFQAFKRQAVEENEAKYGAEIREKYGDEEVDASNAAMLHMSQEQYQTFEALGKEIVAKLEQAVHTGARADEPIGEELTKLHRQWLSYTWKQYSPESHKGLAQMYVEDGRFTAYYDSQIKGCASFLRDCIMHWADELN